ncbi:MAG TPA: TIGR00296 family protein [Candidatus Deferrimicrobiaceae bacterium]|nr:TIGR00296 family protein [Candidatus Deferrimicrobiaceae bacterium]
MPFELTDQEGKFLIQLARNTVTEYLENGKTLKSPKDTPEKLFEQCGVFVTISSIQNGEKALRGCIGYPYPTSPLVEAVIDSAINASTQDPRFEPMTAEELDKVVFEVSVLTPPEPVSVNNPKDYLNKIKVGEDGLIIEHGYRKGLLLPQVPIEWGWCEEEFLCQCCIKAGLPPDSWLTKDTKISKFKAIIFEEQTPKGEIIRLNLAKQT